MNKGVPANVVSTPTGISLSKERLRVIKSARSTSAAPIKPAGIIALPG